MSLGNREDGRGDDAKSEYLANALYKELRITASCVFHQRLISFLCTAVQKKGDFL